jgi:hypothetical protein
MLVAGKDGIRLMHGPPPLCRRWLTLQKVALDGQHRLDETDDSLQNWSVQLQPGSADGSFDSDPTSRDGMKVCQRCALRTDD